MVVNFEIFLYILLFIFPCHALDCGVRKESKVQALIVDGEASYPGQWPWLVSLHKIHNEKTNELRYFCGSTLISSQRLLTGNS